MPESSYQSAETSLARINAASAWMRHFSCLKIASGFDLRGVWDVRHRLARPKMPYRGRQAGHRCVLGRINRSILAYALATGTTANHWHKAHTSNAASWPDLNCSVVTSSRRAMITLYHSHLWNVKNTFSSKTTPTIAYELLRNYGIMLLEKRYAKMGVIFSQA